MPKCSRPDSLAHPSAINVVYFSYSSFERVALDRVFSNTAMKQRSVVPRSFPYLDVLYVYIVFFIVVHDIGHILLIFLRYISHDGLFTLGPQDAYGV
jgi:hypothetical protein